MLLRFENVTKTYGGAKRKVGALAGVSLDIAGGDFVAVCGPSGCGKSTLLLTAGALLRPDGGRVTIDGADPYALSPEARARFRAVNIGFVFQQFHLVPYLNVLDNVLTASMGAPAPAPALGSNGGGGNGANDVRQRAQQLLERFGLNDRVVHVPAELSTGERQRTALARALLNQPKLLLADEPTGNLDPANAAVVMQYLRQFADAGGAVLLVTHDADAADLADRIVRMTAGRIDAPAAASEGVPS